MSCEIILIQLPKDTCGYGLWCPNTEVFDLVGYRNANYVGCKAERKSTSGHC